MISYPSPRGQNQSRGREGPHPSGSNKLAAIWRQGGRPEPTSIFHELKDVSDEMLSPTISFSQVPFLWLILVCVLSLYVRILGVLPASHQT